ncbi:MAG TPA: hypothetical protein VGD27_13650 [Longimicrobiales bacterium]
MSVRVDQPGHDRLAREIDEAGTAAAQCACFLVAAHKDDALATDGDGLRLWQCRVGRVNAAVEQDEVSLLSGGGLDQRGGAQERDGVVFQR